MSKKSATPTTVQGWLSKLPEPYRSQSILNSDSRKMEIASDSLSFSLVKAFLWKESKEGEAYWQQAYQKAEEEWV